MKKSVLGLSPRLIPISSKEEAMLTEALGLIDYFHPQMRKQAMDFAKRANLQKAVTILLKLEEKRKADYAFANAPTLFDFGSAIRTGTVPTGASPTGTAFDLKQGKKGR